LISSQVYYLFPKATEHTFNICKCSCGVLLREISCFQSPNTTQKRLDFALSCAEQIHTATCYRA